MRPEKDPSYICEVISCGMSTKNLEMSIQKNAIG